MIFQLSPTHKGRWCYIVGIFYQGWKVGEGEEGDHRSGATRDNLFTHKRKVCIYKIILYNPGLKRERIQAGYALLFHHILFTMCDVGRSIIRGNIRKTYYYEFENLSNIYGIQLGLGREYGHKFIYIYLDELVWKYGVVQREGVKCNGEREMGGSLGSSYAGRLASEVVRVI